MQSATSEKISNIVISILFCIMLISPFIFDLKPELLYNEKKEIVQKLSGELNLPTIYFLNSQKGGFLNDIYIFSKINESYIAKDIYCNENTIQKIMENKDISNGIIILINDDQNNNFIIDTVKKSLNFTNCNYLQRLSSCDAFYIY